MADRRKAARPGKILLLLLFIALANRNVLADKLVVINEFAASNVQGIRDEDGKHADWIEIYNAGNDTVDVGGYTLTDDLDDVDKWTFPARIINPGEFLLVWASGKDRKSGAELHTNFKLARSGEQIGLFSPQGEPLDTLSFGPQYADVSYGRYPDGVGQWRFLDPTPNSPNAQTVDPPQFNIQQGFYAAPITLEISTQAPGAVVRYTSDGSDVTESSPLFQDPIPLSQTTVIRAASFKGPKKSLTVTKTFFIGEELSMPALSLVTDPDNLYDPDHGIYVNYDQEGSAWERPGNIAYFQKDHDYAFDINCGLRIHGSSSRHFPKKSFRLYFRSDYGTSRLKYDLFPKCKVEEFKRLVLHSGSADALFYPGRWTLIKNALAAECARPTYALAARCRFTAVYLNGKVWGLYLLRERIDDEFIKSHFGIEDMDLLKGNTTQNLDVVEGSNENWNDVYYFFLKHYFDDQANYQKAQTLINVDNFTDYQIIGSYIGDHDWPHNNFYVFRPQSGDDRWRWLFWDSDHSFANHIDEDVTLNSIDWITRAEPRPDLKAWGSPDREKYIWGTLMLRKLLENKEYTEKFINRYADLLNSQLSERTMSSRVDSLKAVLKQDINKEYDTWKDEAHENSSLYWDDNMAFIKDYVQRRPDILRGYLQQKFKLGGIVTLNVDVSGGGTVEINSLAPRVFPWTGKYFTTFPVVLKARPKPGSEFLGWSDPNLPTRDSVAVHLADDSSVTALFSDEMFKQKIKLDKGWNMFSLAVSPKDSLDLFELLNPIRDELLKVIDERGRTIEKLFGAWHDYIGLWQPTEGYVIKVRSDTTLQLMGREIQTPFEIPLTPGWNMISYVCWDSKQDAEALFHTLIETNCLEKVIDRKGQTLDKVLGVWQNYIGNVKPDEGLKVKVNRACILIESCGHAGLAKMKSLRPKHFICNFVNPYLPMQFYITAATINRLNLQQGDEIAVFDGDQLVGASAFSGSRERPFLIVANQSDNLIRGFQNGHAPRFKIWKKAEAQEIPLANADLTVLEKNGRKGGGKELIFEGLSSVVLSFSAPDKELHSPPRDMTLHQNYPNPFNLQTAIQYELPRPGHVSINIYNVRGRLVKTLVNKKQPTGRYRLIWDATDSSMRATASGLY